MLLSVDWPEHIYPSAFTHVIPLFYFIWSNLNKIFTVVNAVAINVMVQCSETELNHYINANGIIWPESGKSLWIISP